MKKYLTLLLTLCMVFGLLAGCAEKPAEPSALSPWSPPSADPSVSVSAALAFMSLRASVFSFAVASAL